MNWIYLVENQFNPYALLFVILTVSMITLIKHTTNPFSHNSGVSCIDDLSSEIFSMDMKPLGMVNATEANNILELKTCPYSLDTFLNEKNYEMHVLALEVKEIRDKYRNMINATFIGKETELKIWLGTFAAPFEMATNKFMDEVFTSFCAEIIRPSIKKGLSDATQNLSITLVQTLERELVQKEKEDANVYVAELKESLEENTFTTNDHYLNATGEEFRKTHSRDFSPNFFLDKQYRADDMDPFFKDVCKIRAFLKTRKKVLPDTIQLHITKKLNDLHKSTKERIRDYLSTIIDKIKESNGRCWGHFSDSVVK